MATDTITIGVLALQGGYHEHIHLLKSLRSQGALPHNVDLHVREVKKSEELRDIDGLIIPGGESTTMAIIAESMGLMDSLRDFVKLRKKAVWGTCAGLIMISNRAEHQKQQGQSLIGGLDVTVDRNAFGSQKDSFLTNLSPPPGEKSVTEHPFPAIFIRAPIITSVDSPDVEVLANVDHAQRKGPVAVRQGFLLGTAFHPELTNDSRWHQFFLSMVTESRKAV